MCRLYGFRANEETKVECTLVYAQNALMVQSAADLRGVAHPDGWGIARYQKGLPEVERRTTAASSDLYFSTAAERSFSRTVVAHVRRASVGKPALANTHPFTWGRWTFAHNGTVTAFDRVRKRLEAETEPELQRLRRGETDSEQSFYWLMTRLTRAGLAAEEGSTDIEALMAAVGEAVRMLAGYCFEAGAEAEPKLNFLLTDGELLVASRWNNSLHWVERPDVRDCEICGIPHVRHDEDCDYRAVVIASEPISHEDWREVPNHTVLAVDADIRTHRRLIP